MDGKAGLDVDADWRRVRETVNSGLTVSVNMSAPRHAPATL